MTKHNATTGGRAQDVPELRPSRAEREPYTDVLAEALADGRLTVGLFDERVAKADAAASFSQLDALVSDLPCDPEALRPPHARLHVRVRAGSANRWRRRLAARPGQRAAAQPGARPAARSGRRLLWVPVLFAVAFLGTSIGWAVVDGTAGDAAARAFSTKAGVQVKAPEHVPRLDSSFASVRPMTATTFARAAEYVDDNDLGFITEISTTGDSTTVFTVNAAQRVHYYRLSADQAPTGAASSSEAVSIADMKAATKLDPLEVLRRARSDLVTDAQVNSIAVGSQLADYQKQRYVDVVTATFSGSNADGEFRIVYRLKDMKVLQRD